jgi:hypothetical protein
MKQIREIKHIAQDISKDWKNPYFGAVPYLNAMHSLSDLQDSYYYDSAKTIIRYFLSNAQSWRGEVAKQIKAELKQLIK